VDLADGLVLIRVALDAQGIAAAHEQLRVLRRPP
jgi:hypothetical protein